MNTAADDPLFAPLIERLRPAAVLSDCGRYRYRLTRVWDLGRPLMIWIMLNPSTADASQDDATIRRCTGFAWSWGHGGIVVLNLFALRATDPGELLTHPSPVAEPGPVPGHAGNRNDFEITSFASARDRRVVAAWGCHGTFMGRDREVLALLGNRPIECLGLTKEGHPRHPVRLRGDLRPVPWEPRAT